MNKKDTKIIRHIITHIVALLTIIFAIIHLSGRENYARQLQQINEYINELSSRTSQHISDILESKRSSIESIAYLYGEAITSEEVDSKHLNALEENSGFDRIRFVNAKGESFTSDGKFADFAGKRILLVEGNELNREISREILENEGFIVNEAEEGNIAVEKIKTSTEGFYSFILMDIQMPRVNGYEATKQIRSLNNKRLAAIPIIAVTANAFDEDKRAAAQAGMNGHVAKPIEINKLRKKLFKCI